MPQKGKKKETHEEKEDEYLPFYQGIFSQWHHSTFTDPKLPEPYNKNKFTSCENYMMFRKALLFKDVNSVQKILQEHNCRKVKALGRKVKGFGEDSWNSHREIIVVRGNQLKFSQNKTLRKKLLSTFPKKLVEASPRDRIWGIGIGVNHPNVQDPRFWRGENLLGKCLDKARTLIMKEKSRSLVSQEYDSNSDSDIE